MMPAANQYTRWASSMLFWEHFLSIRVLKRFALSAYWNCSPEQIFQVL